MIRCLRRLLPPVLSLAVGLSGCTANPKPFAAHHLLVDPDGYALDTDYEDLRQEHLEAHLETTVFKGIQQHMDRLKAQAKTPAACGDKLRLLIFVHGGLNTYAASFKRMERMLAQRDGEAAYTCYYPIFVNWESGLGSSIADDLFRLRFGRPSLGVGIVTSPFVIASRLISSVAAMPMSLMHNADTMEETLSGAVDEGDPGYCVAGDAVFYLPLQGLYIATMPLVEGFGRPAWQIMRRRAELAVSSRLVDGPEDKDVYASKVYQAVSSNERARKARLKERPTEGAIRTFARKLREHIRYDDSGKWYWLEQAPPPPPDQIPKQMPAKKTEAIVKARAIPVEITLVGHSMGSLLLNRLLSVLDNVEGAKQGDLPMPVRRIVYMAPAAPVNELEDFMVPYLHYNTTAEFWMFLLNRRDETREIPYDGAVFFLPRGSLLAWIDSYLEAETTVGQSTSGRTRNVREYYQVERSPTRRGTVNCLTPSWEAHDGPRPELKPISDQYRKLLASAPRGTVDLQNQGRFRIYESPARVGDKTVPSEHGDFTESHFFLEVLCHADGEAFNDKAVCGEVPYWLSEPPWWKFWDNYHNPHLDVPLFGMERLP